MLVSKEEEKGMHGLGIKELQRFLMWVEETYGPEEILEMVGASEEYLAARVKQFMESEQ